VAAAKQNKSFRAVSLQLTAPKSPADLGRSPSQERARSLGGYVDFITVMRPAGGAASAGGSGGSGGGSGGNGGSSGGACLVEGLPQARGGAPAAGGAAAGGLVPVQLPTGSVRASLGALSRWEDAAALIGFLRDTYAE
jgi:hypothetical protein